MRQVATDLATFSLGGCRGARPWLGRHANEECCEPCRLLIRTASNAWFLQVVSVLSLPDRASEVEELWDRLQVVQDENAPGVMKTFPDVANRLAPFSDEEVLDAVAVRRSGGTDAERPIKHVELAASRVPAPDFVWTGPQVAGLHARDTRRVSEELMGSAERSVRASTYVFSEGPRAFKTLAERMDAVPELDVTLLPNIERRRGDTTAADSLIRRFADEFRGREWPGTARPKVYYDPRSVETDSPGGVLHAKAVVADEESVFITSANLTAAAQDRNIELGLVVRDRALAATTIVHFRTLMERDLLRRLPDA